MGNKLKVTIEGPAATGKTTLAALLTWALRKFNYTLTYNGADRQKWMQLSGDETELSHRLGDMFKKNLFPEVEVVEEVTKSLTETEELRAEVSKLRIQTNDIVAKLNAVTAERDALKMRTDPVTVLAEAIGEKKE